jgi:ribosomal protein L34E
MLRRHDRANDCEICQKKPATRRARFTAHFLQSEPTPLVVEERVAKTELEKRVCDDCAKQLQGMKNVTDLSLEEL